MGKLIESKSGYENLSPQELYEMIFENFRIDELKYILKKIDYSQRDFLSRMNYSTYTALARYQELNRNEISSQKTCISSKWIEFLRSEIGDERLLILRELFKKSQEFKKMKKNDKIIDDKLLQGRKIEDDDEDFYEEED